MNFYTLCEDERKNETSSGWMGKERNGAAVRVSVRPEGSCWSQICTRVLSDSDSSGAWCYERETFTGRKGKFSVVLMSVNINVLRNI